MMQRHGAMEWVTQLDKALAEDRLILNCQKILPVRGGSTIEDVHYEILLSMQDEMGDIVAPTELINAGMSLTGVMKFLGHRDFHMTLRYTAITQETVRQEYSDALSSIARRHRHDLLSKARLKKLRPDRIIADLVRWLEKQGHDKPNTARRARLLARRLKRIQQEVANFDS